MLRHVQGKTGRSGGQSSRSNRKSELFAGSCPANRALWRKHHRTYNQTKHVIEQVRRELRLQAPRERHRTVDRLDRAEVERLIEAAYNHSSRYGFMIKLLFYTGARVSEFV
jgi:integrase